MSRKIKFFDVQGFQSHVRTRIPLSDFTVIVGQSSSGKSALLRAANWLFYGDWDASWFNDEAKPAVVALEFDDGVRIIRMREGKDNRAAIIRDGETSKYKTFGDIIPGIENLVNVRPIEIGAKSINLNFSMQDDPIFMVSESKPTRAAWMGRLYGAHIINEMLRTMAKDKKTFTAKQKDSEERLAKLQEDIKQYSTLEEQESLLAEVQGQAKDLTITTQLAQECNMLELNRESLTRDSWVTQVDVLGVRAELGSLASLGLLNQAYQMLELNRASLKKDSWVTQVSIADARSELAMFASMELLQAQILHVNTEKAKLRGETKLLKGIDIPAIKTELQQYESLQGIQALFTQFSESMSEHKVKSKLLADVDVSAVKKDVSDYEALLHIHLALTKHHKSYAEHLCDKEETTKQSEKVHASLQELLVANGKCPVCDQSVCDIGEVITNVRKLIGTGGGNGY